MIAAVLVNLAVGLVLTAAIGLWMVGTLNLISVAFAVLFVGLGRRFRHPVQRALPRRALRSPRSSRGDRGDGARRRRASAARRGLDRGRLLFVSADRLCRSFRARPDRGNRHDHRVRDDRNAAAGAARGAQARRRKGAGRLCGARAARPFPRPSRRLGRRADARRGDSRPAAAQGPALRLQSPEPSLEAGRIGLHAPRPDARSRHEPQHDRHSGARSRSGDESGEGAGGSAGGGARAHDRELHPEGPGREARPHR